MNMDRTIEVVCCHAEGEVGDVIVGGVPPPPGASLWEQARWIESDGALRDYVLNEPRGGVFRHVNLLVPAINPKAAMGFIIMEPEDTPPMSGSNSICVAKVLLETGIIPMKEPVTKMVLEAPGGLVNVTAQCKDGKVKRVMVRNVPSFAAKIGASLEVDGLGTLTADTAYGGDSFVIVDAQAVGFEVVPDEARDLARAGVRITAAANEQLGFSHPYLTDLKHISFCQFAAPVTRRAGQKIARNAVVVRPGKIDRSPTGTGVCARMAVMHAKGQMEVGDTLVAQSIIGSEFLGRIESETELGPLKAIRPTISGRAFITGRQQLTLDQDDPWPAGYRLSDTWPKLTNVR